MVRRAAIPLAFFAILSPFLPAAPAGADVCGPQAEPVPLCATNTITGGSTGYVLVSAPDEGVVLDDSNIHIDGPGDYVGVMLTADPPYLTAPDCGKTQQGVDITLCPAGEVHIRSLAATGAEGKRTFISISEGFCSPSCTLAGTYRLYLLTDGSPVTVTLSFAELSGAQTLSPGHSVNYDTRVPDPSVEPPDSPFYGAGFTATMPSPSIQFGVVTTDAAASAATNAGMCHYLGDPGDPRLAYQPACPGLADGIDMFFTHILPVDGGTMMYGYAYPFATGPNGVGGWTTTAGAGAESFVTVSQLAFDHA